MNESLSVGASHLAYGVSLRGALYCENGHEKAGHGWNENVSAYLPPAKTSLVRPHQVRDYRTTPKELPFLFVKQG